MREFVVVAQRVEHEYDGLALTDPWGLVFRVARGWRAVADEPGRPRGRRRAVGLYPAGGRSPQPLVLRARRGEWVRVTLINEVLTGADDDPLRQPFDVEPSPPPLPLESVDERGYPDERTVTPRVSLHPGLLRFDVVSDDGAYVGRNQDGTVPPAGDPPSGHEHGGRVVVRHGHHGGNWREYWWYADDELAPAGHAEGPGQVCLLRDAADVRNHRHHGLVGALVVEPGDVTPVDPGTGSERWWGSHAVLVDGDGALVANEKVLILQDGLRLFVAGDPDSPVRDTVVGDDPEDAGQKGISYRTALVHPSVMLADRAPATPIWRARVGQQLWLRLVSAADKPRNHTFTVHGMAWRVTPWRPGDGGPWAGAVAGVSAASVHDLVLHARAAGDHAYRSGVFRWAVTQGMWGIVRVE